MCDIHDVSQPACIELIRLQLDLCCTYSQSLDISNHGAMCSFLNMEFEMMENCEECSII